VRPDIHLLHSRHHVQACATVRDDVQNKSDHNGVLYLPLITYGNQQRKMQFSFKDPTATRRRAQLTPFESLGSSVERNSVTNSCHFLLAVSISQFVICQYVGREDEALAHIESQCLHLSISEFFPSVRAFLDTLSGAISLQLTVLNPPWTFPSRFAMRLALHGYP